MGNIFGIRGTNHALTQAIPPDQLWLQNRQLLIQKEDYTLLNRRGGGAFGSVWEARTTRGHHAAVKVFSLHDTATASDKTKITSRAWKEADLIYKMNGDSRAPIVFGFSYNPQLSVALIAMELGDDSLQQRVQYLHSYSTRSSIYDNGYIPARDRKSIWLQFVDILLALKRHHIIHSDIKPANLVFFGPTLKVVDFGVAQQITVGGIGQANGGTIGSSAPECAMRGYPLTTKADIWSAGIILYYLTYGRRANSQPGQFPPMPGLSRSPLVHDIIQKCFQYDPNRRPSHYEIISHPYTSSPALA